MVSQRMCGFYWATLYMGCKNLDAAENRVLVKLAIRCKNTQWNNGNNYLLSYTTYIRYYLTWTYSGNSARGDIVKNLGLQSNIRIFVYPKHAFSKSVIILLIFCLLKLTVQIGVV